MLAKPPCRCTSIRKTTQGLWVPRSYLLVAGWWQWMEMVPCWVWELSSMRSPPKKFRTHHLMIQTIQGADGASVSDYTRSVISRVEVWDFHQFFHRFSFGWVGWCRPRVFLPGPQCRNGGNFSSFRFELKTAFGYLSMFHVAFIGKFKQQQDTAVKA